MTDGPSPSTRKIVLDRDGHRCRACGKKHPFLTLHHLNGKNPGTPGRHKPENLLALCKGCHKMVEQFIANPVRMEGLDLMLLLAQYRWRGILLTMLRKRVKVLKTLEGRDVPSSEIFDRMGRLGRDRSIVVRAPVQGTEVSAP